MLGKDDTTNPTYVCVLEELVKLAKMYHGPKWLPLIIFIYSYLMFCIMIDTSPNLGAFLLLVQQFSFSTFAIFTYIGPFLHLFLLLFFCLCHFHLIWCMRLIHRHYPQTNKLLQNYIRHTSLRFLDILIIYQSLYMHKIIWKKCIR